MNITISKTIQVRQYEPLTVTISDDGDGSTAEGRKELYERVSKTLKSVIIKEYNKFDTLADDGVVEANKARSSTKSIPTLKKKKQTKIVGQLLKLILALREQGWLWTEEYIWHKQNAYPGKWD